MFVLKAIRVGGLIMSFYSSLVIIKKYLQNFRTDQTSKSRKGTNEVFSYKNCIEGMFAIKIDITPYYCFLSRSFKYSSILRYHVTNIA